jgi:flagellar motor switch protein FliN
VSEETLPTPEEMRARYADVADESPQGDGPAADEPEAVAVPTPDTRHPTPEPEPEPEPEPVEDIPDPGEDLALHLLDVKVRLWAELGRARLPLAHAVGLGSGAIVDLDKGPDEQLEILVNGRPFAKGTLLLEDGEWAVRLEEIVATPQALEQASSSGSGA